jgi:hypothetical protein
MNNSTRSAYRSTQFWLRRLRTSSGSRFPLSWRESGVIFGIILSGYILILALSGLVTIRSINQLNSSGTDGLGESAVDRIESLYLAMDDVEEEVALTQSLLIPIDLICDVTSWIPPFGSQCDSYSTLFNVFDRSMLAARSTLRSAVAIDELLDTEGETKAPVFSKEWVSLIRQIEVDLSVNKAELQALSIDAENIRGSNPVFDRFADQSDSAIQESMSVVEFALVVIDALDSGSSLATGMKVAVDDLSSARGLGQFKRIWTDVWVSSTDFEHRYEEIIRTLPKSLEGSSVESRLVEIQDQITPLFGFVNALMVMLETFDQATEFGFDYPGSFITEGGLAAVVRHLDEHELELQSAGKAISGLPQLAEDSELFGQIIGKTQLSRLESILDDNLKLIESLPDLHRMLSRFIAIDGSKRYLILGMSPAEIRPAGGFTSSVWVVEFDHGRLLNTEYVSIVDFGESGQLDYYPPPPEPLELHMDAQARYLADVGWSPNFAQVAENALLMANNSGIENLDGVLAVNQSTIVNWINLLGTVEIDGEQIVIEDPDSYIEQKTDEHGTGFLEELFVATIDAMSSSNFDSIVMDLSESILDDLNSRNIMIKVEDDELDQLLTNAGFSGEFMTSFGENVAVFDSNIGWNKVDTNISRDLEYDVNISEDGSLVSTLTLNYTNHSVPQSENCPDQTPPRGAQNLYSLLKNGCYWNYVRVYLPVNVFDLSYPDFPAPDTSIAVRSGLIIDGGATSVETIDDAGRHIAGLLLVPAGATRSVEFEYSSPPGTAIRSDESDEALTLSVIFYPQAGLADRAISGTISFPEGYLVDPTLQSGFDVSANSLAYEFVLDTVSTREFSAVVGQ